MGSHSSGRVRRSHATRRPAGSFQTENELNLGRSEGEPGSRSRLNGEPFFPSTPTRANGAVHGGPARWDGWGNRATMENACRKEHHALLARSGSGHGLLALVRSSGPDAGGPAWATGADRRREWRALRWRARDLGCGGAVRAGGSRQQGAVRRGAGGRLRSAGGVRGSLAPDAGGPGCGAGRQTHLAGKRVPRSHGLHPGEHPGAGRRGSGGGHGVRAHDRRVGGDRRRRHVPSHRAGPGRSCGPRQGDGLRPGQESSGHRAGGRRGGSSADRPRGRRAAARDARGPCAAGNARGALGRRRGGGVGGHAALGCNFRRGSVALGRRSRGALHAALQRSRTRHRSPRRSGGRGWGERAAGCGSARHRRRRSGWRRHRRRPGHGSGRRRCPRRERSVPARRRGVGRRRRRRSCGRPRQLPGGPEPGPRRHGPQRPGRCLPGARRA